MSLRNFQIYSGCLELEVRKGILIILTGSMIIGVGRKVSSADVGCRQKGYSRCLGLGLSSSALLYV